MAGKVEARRAVLRDTLIAHAETRIKADGLKNLRARDLAKDAGCALGAIYNVFGDLNDLVLAVNARTFHRLGAAVAETLAQAPQNATQQLIAMSHAYHRFAAENFNAWRALFDIERPAGEAAPDWRVRCVGQNSSSLESRRHPRSMRERLIATGPCGGPNPPRTNRPQRGPTRYNAHYT